MLKIPQNSVKSASELVEQLLVRAGQSQTAEAKLKQVSEYLSETVEQFPKLDEVSPFFRAIGDVLFDADHVKLALQCLKDASSSLQSTDLPDSSTSGQQGEEILKQSTQTIEALSPHLSYLEQVRLHMRRFPTKIDPNTRTVMLLGYPNVGKSTLMNHLTRANVDVVPFVKDSMNIFLGSIDYKYMKWECIDMPGTVDRPLETIQDDLELKLIMSLSHIRFVAIFLLDLSEQCGKSIEDQVHLLLSLKPLLERKPLVIAFSKSDLVKKDSLDDQKLQLLAQLTTEYPNVKETSFSSLQADSVGSLKALACDLLLEFRHAANLGGLKIS